MIQRVPSRKRMSTGLIVAYVFLSTLGILNVFPFYWAILAAFKYPQDIIRVPANPVHPAPDPDELCADLRQPVRYVLSEFAHSGMFIDPSAAVFILVGRFYIFKI